MASDDRRASHHSTAPHDPKDRDGYVLDFDEDFDAPTLGRSRWLPHYLPQWSSRSASEARYELTGSYLGLRIDEDQEPSGTRKPTGPSACRHCRRVAGRGLRAVVTARTGSTLG
jgi:hypothetical protein